MARPRLGDAPLSAAERQRRRRERLAENRDAERRHETESPGVQQFREDFHDWLVEYLSTRPELREYIGGIERVVYADLPLLLVNIALAQIFQRHQGDDKDKAE